MEIELLLIDFDDVRSVGINYADFQTFFCTVFQGT